MFAPSVADSEEGFADHLFDTRAEATETHFWFTSRDNLILAALKRYCPLPLRILEIGAGSGHVLDQLTKWFPKSEVIGAEISVAGLSAARKRCGERAAYVQFDATQMPYDSDFQLIGAFDVLEHIQDDAKVLTECRRSLTSDGVMIVTVPQHPELWSHKDELFCHKRRYRPGELEARMQDAGFAIQFSTSYVFFLMPALWFATKVMRGEGVYRADKELQISKPINALLKAVMTIERWFILAGIRFPVGGSRIIVARCTE